MVENADEYWFPSFVHMLYPTERYVVMKQERD